MKEFIIGFVSIFAGIGLFFMWKWMVGSVSNGLNGIHGE